MNLTPDQTNLPDFQLRAERLGIYTRNYSKPVVAATVVDRQTGEILDFESKRGGLVKIETNQDTRWRKFKNLELVQRLMPKSRTGRVCHLCQVPSQKESDIKETSIKVSKLTGQASFSGLMQCGSVWLCPVCSSKISVTRRDELRLALDAADCLGWSVHMVTLTAPHQLMDDLTELNQRLNTAFSKLSQGRNSLSQQSKSSGYQMHGYIKAREITTSMRNGFHVHFHVLVFSDMPKEWLLSFYQSRWLDACESSGLERPSLEHGVSVEDGTFAADYVGKWGLEFEMTTGHTKKSRKGYTPFQLLDVINSGGADDMTKEQASWLWSRYADAMVGQRQLHWSVNLRKKLSLIHPSLLTSRTDQDIVDSETVEEMITVHRLTKIELKAINFYKSRASVLNVAESSPSILPFFIANLVSRYADFLETRQRPSRFIL